jgi:MFS family permease
MSVLNALRISRQTAPAFVIIGIFWGAFAAQAPVLKAQIGADDATFGLLLLGTSLGLVGTMIFAPAYDRALGAKAMPIGCVLLIAAFLLPGIAVVPLTFFGAMLCAGMASGLLDVTMNARVSELEAASGKTLMNANHAMFSVGYAASALATGAMREMAFSPSMVFACVGVVALVLSFATRMAPLAEEEDSSAGGVMPVFTVVLCGAIVLIAFMSEAAVEAWSALHVERTLGGGAAEGALGPAMLGFTMAVGRFGGQAVSEWLSDTSVIFWAAIMAAVGALIAASASEPLIAYLGFGVLGLGVSVIGPIGLAIVGRLVPANVRTKAISRTAVIGFMGFFLAPAIMGSISQVYGLRVAFAAIALLLLCTFPVLTLLRKRGA